MKIHLEELENEVRFEVKLQIELYNLASKVIDENKKESYEKYMRERQSKIRKILKVEHGSIYEKEEKIFEF